MPIFAWNSTYSVNIPELDAQHKRLFNMINTLHDALREGKGKERVGQVLTELIDYTHTHFAAEETMMMAKKYPAYLAHKSLHDAFTKQVQGVREQFARGTLNISMDVMAMLKDWLVNHIQGSDQQYAPYLAEQA